MSYVSPRLVERCELHQSKFDKSWLIQLATGTKRRVTYFVKKCEFYMNNFKTKDDLNTLPLGSYDLLIGMDCLEKHKVVLNYYDKTFSCIDEVGNAITIKGIPRKVSIHEISSLQMKKSVRKGCKMFFVHILDNSHETEKINIRNIPILNEF